MPKIPSQKILDIIPPPKIEEKIQLKRERKPPQPYQRLSSKRILVIIFLLILGGLSFYFIFRKAEIIIWPVTQEENFKEKITVDLKADQVDLSTNTIPGNILE